MADDIIARLEALEAAVRQLCAVMYENDNRINENDNRINGSVNHNHKSRPASYDDVLKYVVGELKLTENDAAALWEHWQGNGFKVNGKVMRSWKATASCWERCKIFYPSLRHERPGIPTTDRRRQTLAQEQGRFRL